jgi:multidrug resistance efflux pump
MRFVVTLMLFLTIFTLLNGESPAQKNDDAEKAKRIAQIEKELAELQERVATLTAELAKLRAVEANPLRGIRVVVVKGTITKMDPAGFWLKQNEINPPILFILVKESEIMYSDNQKAKPSDLKVAQRVSVHSSMDELARKKEPQSGGAYKVIIEKQDAPK